MRCRRCDEVIGVYEPMIVFDDGRARSTSRAAEQTVEGPEGECYHAACYPHAQGEDPVLD
jgi:hypothetical protein